MEEYDGVYDGEGFLFGVWHRIFEASVDAGDAVQAVKYANKINMYTPEYEASQSDVCCTDLMPNSQRSRSAPRPRAALRV